MKKNRLLILLFASAMIMQSCKIMYTPNMENVPLMKEQNEIRATIGPSNFQGAYAVTQNFGIMVNGQYRDPKWTVTSGSRKYDYDSKKTLIEGGIGYCKLLGDVGIFEVYGGGGLGSSSYNRKYTDTVSGASQVFDKYSAKTSRIFIQPSIGLTNNNVDFAFSCRFVSLKFSSIDTAGYKQSDLLGQDLANLDKPNYMFLEPALTLRVGYKTLKFHAQLIYSLKLNSEPLNYSPVVFNIGAHINIAQRNKASKN